MFVPVERLCHLKKKIKIYFSLIYEEGQLFNVAVSSRVLRHTAEGEGNQVLVNRFLRVDESKTTLDDQCL